MSDAVRVKQTKTEFKDGVAEPQKSKRHQVHIDGACRQQMSLKICRRQVEDEGIGFFSFLNREVWLSRANGLNALILQKKTSLYFPLRCTG